MRNRAKCKLCGDLIESFTVLDYVQCSCEEIAISGGSQKLEVYYKNLENFLRVGEDDKIIEVQEEVEGIEESKPFPDKMTKKEKQEVIDHMISLYENLPVEAKMQPASHSDLEAVLLLVRRLFS